MEKVLPPASMEGSSVNPSKKRFHDNDPLVVMANTARKARKAKAASAVKKMEEETAKLKAESDEKAKEGRIIHARSYQMVILAKALRENTIAYLETGCGKTLIAILLIKEMASCMREKNERFRAVFMAPTVCLVLQQTSVLKINLDLQVECYYGAKGVDKWCFATWKREMDANEVFVLTPMVLLDALRHGFLSLDSFQLLIFDECHRAQKKHPYSKIMQEYYHNPKKMCNRPRVFGMTASPVTCKGVASTEDSALQMLQLEKLLDCKVSTVEDDVEIQQYVPKPNQKVRLFAAPVHSYDALLQQLESLVGKHEEMHTSAMADGDVYKDLEEMNRKLRKNLKKLYGCIRYSLEELGLLCAYESASSLLSKIKADIVYGECQDQRAQSSKETFLNEAMGLLRTFLPSRAVSINSKDDTLLAVNMGLLSPKVSLLVNCLLEYQNTENMHCIIFVERVVTAMVLARVMSRMGCLSFVRCSFLSGTTATLDVMGKKHQQDTLSKFHSGRLNVLVATDVAEEGIDVQKCSSVIRFDLSRTVRSFIQSRGRARMPGSDYIIFLEEDNEKQFAQLMDLKQSEESMKDQALNRTYSSVSPWKNQAEDLEAFIVKATGAIVTVDSSVSLISRFCSNLPGDAFYRPSPQFVFQSIEGDDSNHVCKLIFPPNGPFRELIGPPRRSRTLAKQSVCLEACKMLHALGQLTDNLIPVVDVEKPEEEEVMNLSGKNVTGAGTNKRKELHGTVSTDALVGDWIDSSGALSLHAYLICFEFHQKEEDPYSDFVLLLKAALDDDIANTDFPIYLSNGRKATAKFFDAGMYSLSAGQFEDAKAYHQLIFNGMFGKLIWRSHKKGTKSGINSMLALNVGKDVNNQLWPSAQTYLVLPLLSCQSADEAEEIPINWKAIRDAANIARLFPHLWCMQQSLNVTNEGKSLNNNNAILQMASGAVPDSELVGMAVVTIHTGRIYSVVEVLDGKNATCPIEGAEHSQYASYCHYFQEKYKRVLQFPKQPLIRVKQSHRIHNLLTQDESSAAKKKENVKKPKMSALVELPAELCLCTGLPNALIRSLYLFPSVFHRFNALLLAAQLRNTIAKDVPQCSLIPGTVMMQALTTLRCLEGFSLESLELLGDSFLKYAVSRYLYLVYDRKHEGQLSNRRSRLICNETLHRLAVLRQLPGYIRDEPFRPEHWNAPGMLPGKSIKCKCNLENLTFSVDGLDKGDEAMGCIFRIGKSCNKGHRWMCSKTVSDAIEALIGAYVSCGDSGSALGFMKWIGMTIDFDWSLYEVARNRKVHPKVLNAVNVAGIESQLGYVFGNKALLVEALTHASKEDPHDAYDVLSVGCYQRLEFLGDAVLDFLITRHLFSTHPGLSPGMLSDLRSAAVNNDCFARSAVKHNLQRYLRHGSGELLVQITEFVKAVEAGQEVMFGWEGVRGPKVLGDLLESITGAILVDSGFDLDTVWSVMKPILSPLVTPATLRLHPIRELHELSQSKGWLFVWKKTPIVVSTESTATAQLKIGNEVISESAKGHLKKTARKNAAQKILLALKRRGILHPRQAAEQRDATPIQPNPASEKRTFDGDDNGSEEKRRRFSFDNQTTEDLSLQFKIPLTLDTAIIEELSSVKKEDSKELLSVKEDGKELSSVQVRLNNNPLDIGPQSGGSLLADNATFQVLSHDNLGGKTFGARDSHVIEADAMHPQNVTEMAYELETSINLKMSPTGSRSEDEASACCVNSSYVSNPRVYNELQKASSAEIPLEANKSLIFGRKGLGLWENKSPPIMLAEKGVGRSRLNNICLKEKWSIPRFTTRIEMVLHVEQYVSTVEVECPQGIYRCTSDPMPRKDQAKDNAAAQLFIALSKFNEHK